MNMSKGAGGGGSATPFREAFVFVVGGGNYTEHQNLIDFAAVSRAQRVYCKCLVWSCCRISIGASN
jgi:hypothetical protein